MATSGPNIPLYMRINNECNRKVYSYDCDQHFLSEIVSTKKYPLCCLKHIPVYVYENMDDKIFLNFHWVSTKTLPFFKTII